MFCFEYTGPVIELGVIKSIHKSDAKFAIIQTPGSVIAREFTIRAMNYMEKNSNCSVLCQTVNKIDTTGDRWWGIQPYVLVVNLDHFKKAGRLFFGNRRDQPSSDQLFPEVIDTDGILTTNGNTVARDPESKLFYGWSSMCLHNWCPYGEGYRRPLVWYWPRNHNECHRLRWLCDECRLVKDFR